MRVIFGPWGSETHEPIHLKFGVLEYVHRPTPHAKYDGRCKGGGEMGKLYPRVLFSLFLSSKARTAQRDKRGFSLSAPENVFWWRVQSVGPFFGGTTFNNLG